MKSRFQLFCIIFFLLLCLSNGENTFYRDARMRTIDRNEKGITVAPRIHGGENAAEGQFKYMVFLLAYGSKNSHFPDSTCSASLIHPRWVLTAAHCISSAMIAVAGKANLSDYWVHGRQRMPFVDDINEMKFNVQERKVRQVFVHSKYSTDTNERDLALLLLDSPFNTSNNHHAPVEVLPLSEKEMYTEMTCKATGWGLNDYQKQTFQLMFAPVKAKSTKMGCHYLKRGPFICLEMGKAGICKGDSGSPLVCEGKVWGVASFSLSHSDKPDCFSESEEYYSDLDIAWIRKTMPNGAIIMSGHNYFKLFIFSFFIICKTFSSFVSNQKCLIVPIQR